MVQVGDLSVTLPVLIFRRDLLFLASPVRGGSAPCFYLYDLIEVYT